MTRIRLGWVLLSAIGMACMVIGVALRDTPVAIVGCACVVQAAVAMK
jgi:uncharacterized membrane protein